ncbi:MAG TPA: YihY/virulence factor BrkB family protein [Gaiellaceae bacterium]|nr:YihY/virulence factor BrkB family protein [Gaiellaceae bacterium]
MRARWQSFKAIVALWVELFSKDKLLTYASAITIQALIATVSFVLLGVGLLGATGDRELWNHTIGPAIHRRVLPDVYRGLNAVVQHVFATSSTGLIVFATLLSIWKISNVVRAASDALNVICGTKEERSWKVRLPLSFAISTVFIVVMIGAIVLVTAVHGPGGWEWPVAVFRWTTAIGLIMFAFGVLVRGAPDADREKRWASAGAILAVTAWIVETLIFRWYVTSVADFRSAIGSFTVFIVLAVYLYVGAIILLVSIELDELVRLDAGRPRNRQKLLPLVAGVIRGG